MAPEEHGLLGWLDGPRLVVGAFMLFLAGLTILGILLWSDQREVSKTLEAQIARIDDLAKESRTRAESASAEAVSRCFSGAATAPALQKVLAAIELETMDPEAKQALRNFRRLSEENASTIPECRALAKRLHVPIPKEFAE
jgi:hypothetical protein